MDDSTYHLFDLLTKTAAVLVGAVWTYSNHLVGRTYQLRCEAQVKGSCELTDAGTILFIAATLKNVGLTKFELLHKACGLTVYRCRVKESGDGELAKESMGAISIFKSHTWLEPGEPVFDEAVIRLSLDKKDVAIAVELVISGVVGSPVLRRIKAVLLNKRDEAEHAEEWNSRCIVKIPSPQVVKSDPKNSLVGV